MAKFFVGQRVRLVRLIKFSHLNGTQARIKSIGGEWYDYRADKPCSPDGIELDIFLEGAPAIVAAKHLEPILPSGHRASDYSFSELMDKCRGVVA